MSKDIEKCEVLNMMFPDGYVVVFVGKNEGKVELICNNPLGNDMIGTIAHGIIENADEVVVNT